MKTEDRATLSASGRLNFPPRLRAGVGDSFVIAKAIRERCLQVYSKEHWDEFEKNLYRDNDMLDVDATLRDMDKRYASVDEQGRFAIPAAFREFAGLETEVHFKTVGRKVEFWNKEELDKTMAAAAASKEERLKRMVFRG